MLFFNSIAWVCYAAFLHSTQASTVSCNAGSIPKPEHFGTSVTRIEATEIKGWNAYVPFGLLGASPPTDAIDFCNVSVTYTHPGTNDEVRVYVWLPLEGWNERFVAQGGGGWAAGVEGSISNP